MDDHRDMKRGVIDEEAMRLFPMLAEAFAVITGEHDQSVAKKVLSFKKSDQPPHLRIGECDFPIIGAVSVLFAERRWRAVREVGIVEVHPKEKLAVVILGEPIQRLISHNISRPLHLLKIRFLQPVEIEMVVVKVESLVQAEPRIEDGRTDYGPSGVSLLSENGGERRLVGI